MLRLLNSGSVLYIGRLSLWLAQKGYQVSAVDLGEAAVQLTGSLLSDNDFNADVECQDIFNMRFDDKAFDAVVCFRLLHHFKEKGDQQRLTSELCRVSSKYVVISYFSGYSVTSLRRKLRKLVTGKPVKQNPMSLADLKLLFAEDDYRLSGTVKRSGFLHSLQLAVFEREIV